MRFFALFIFLLSPGIFFGQQNNFPITVSEKLIIDSYTAKNEGYFHTTFKPIIKSTIEGYDKIDKIVFRTGSDSIFISKRKHPWYWKKLLVESFVDVKKDKFSLRIDPLINFEFGNDTTGRMTVNSRGLIIYGDLNDKFSFTTGVLETQAFPEKYISDYIKRNAIAPGQGRVKNFKNIGYDYSYSFGNISYSPSSHFNFQLGHGKQFLGDGYRSLLLSDVPFYYPYFRITSTFKRFQYINLWTSFQEVKPYDNRTLVYQRKHGSFIYLSYLLHKKIELGLFEAIMFQTTDSNSNNILPLESANPLIGARTLKYGLRYKHNALVGLTAKANILKQINFYGQFVLDDIKTSSDTNYSNNRFGYQFGLKFLEPFDLKNFFFLFEYNHVNRNTYTPTIGHQSYSAFNQPLAHPLGADFNEIVFLIRYSYKDFFLQLKTVSFNTIEYESKIGQNILEEYDNNIIGPVAHETRRIQIDDINFETGIFINQKNKLQLVVGIHNRQKQNFIYFALRTNISNLYYDF